MSSEILENKALELCVETFGEGTCGLKERTARTCEEAIEIAQVGGLTRDDVIALVDRCFAKPPGEFYQELGGLAMTTGCLMASVGYTYEAALLDGLQDFIKRQDIIREKHKAKHVKFD